MHHASRIHTRSRYNRCWVCAFSGFVRSCSSPAQAKLRMAIVGRAGESINHLGWLLSRRRNLHTCVPTIRRQGCRSGPRWFFFFFLFFFYLTRPAWSVVHESVDVVFVFFLSTHLFVYAYLFFYSLSRTVKVFCSDTIISSGAFPLAKRFVERERERRNTNDRRPRVTSATDRHDEGQRRPFILGCRQFREF